MSESFNSNSNQIAYDNLSLNAKIMYHKYLRSDVYRSPNLSFVNHNYMFDLTHKF